MIKTPKLVLDDAHWEYIGLFKENFRQKVTKKQLEEYLLEYPDYISYQGRIQNMKYKKVFGNVYEIWFEDREQIN